MKRERITPLQCSLHTALIVQKTIRDQNNVPFATTNVRDVHVQFKLTGQSMHLWVW